MATYKVIQDIEAEDKLLGPLSMRQFVYAGIVGVSGFIAFRLMLISPWLVLPFIPHMVLFAVLAAPFGRDQPSEIWLLARIRYFLKPRKRIWDQSGIKELVTITAPKRIEKVFTDNLSQNEVQSRLQALANTLDSRGWAVKNVNVNLFAQPSYLLAQNASDRLIDLSNMPREVANYDVTASDDMLDENNNPTAQHFNQMIAQSEQSRMQQVRDKMQQAPASSAQSTASNADYWFMGQPPAPQQPGYAVFDGSKTVTPHAPASSPKQPVSQDEQQLLEKIHKEKAQPAAYGHMRRLKPLDEQSPPIPTNPAPSNKAPDPVIQDLARNNDLNVSTIARQANKGRQQPPDDEVVISLR